MNKILSITLLFGAALAFTACTGEEDDLFDKSAAERLDESKAVYTQRFAANGGKWVMEYYPTNGSAAPQGKGYLMLLEFSSKGWVRIAMNNEMSDNKYQEDTSLWKVIADQGPVLSFCTYNANLHYFSDPAIYDTGLGYEGDYEFEIIDLQENAEFAMLKGKKRGTYIRLTALPADTDFDQYLTEVINFKSKLFSASKPNSDVLTIGEQDYVMSNTASGFISIYPWGGDAISETTTHPFLITKRNGNFYFRFRDPMKEDDGDAKVQELVFDNEKQAFSAVEGSTLNAAITGWPIASFVMDTLAIGHKLQMATASEKSDKGQQLYEAMRTELNSKMSYTLQNVQMTVSSEDSVTKYANLRYTYRVRRGQQTVTQAFIIRYDASMDGNILKLSNMYVDEVSQKVMERVPALGTFANMFVNTFVVAANETPFDLSALRFTAQNDADTWFVLTYIN